MKRKSSLKKAAVYLTFLCLIAFFLPVAAQTKKDIKQAEDLGKQGDKAYGAKNFKVAAERYTSAVQLNPANSDLQFKKGYALFSLKDYDPAVEAFNVALERGYKPLDVYRVKIYILIEQKKYDDAITDIEKALTLAPNDGRLLKDLASAQLGRNKPPEALDALKKAVAANPKDGNLHYQMARIYQENGDTVAQGDSAMAALANGTQFVGEAYAILGDSMQKQKKYQEAVEAYQKAISAKPDNLPVYRSLGDLFRHLSRFTEAINVMKQALKQSPEDGGIYTDLSWYFSLAERSQEAMEAARSGIRYLPKNYLAYTNLCRAYNDLKQYDLALAACGTALTLNREDGETYFYLGRANKFLNRMAEATKNFNKSVPGLVDFTKKNPDYSDGFYLLGNAYTETKQLDKAVTAYEKCLALSPNFVWARFNLGAIYVYSNNKAAAVEQYTALQPINNKVAEQLKAQIDKM